MQTGETNVVAMAGFGIFIVLSLVITWFAARRTRSTQDFYAAGRSITALQNGLALAGDYMSAASFLGIAGLVALSGFDGLIYSIGFLVGWPVVVCLIAEPLRNLGKFTFSDVVAFRLRQTPVRVASAAGSLAVVAFYLIAQMVGAGNLIRLLFGLNYETAVVIVGLVMLAYVLFGGMIATTWVQIVKAVLLLSGAFMLAMLVLAEVLVQPAGAIRGGDAAVRRRRAGAGPVRVGSGRWHLAGPGADVRHRGPAAHPDALLHRARCAHRARLGGVCDRDHRRVLPADVRARFRRDGAGRAERRFARSTPAATWRRRCLPRSSADRHSWDSFPPLPLRRFSRSSPA